MSDSDKTVKSSVKAVSSMMIITLLGKLLGLVRDRLLAVNYGSGPSANAFLTASRAPRVFFDAVFASAISASLIPVFSEYLKKRGKKEAFDFAGNFITVMAVLCSALTVLGVVFARQLTLFLAPKYDAETVALCARLTRVMMPTMLFTGVAFSFVGILQSMDEFNVPAAISLVSNCAVILYYYTLNKKFGITGLAAAFLVAWFLQAAVQVPALRKKGFRLRPSLSFRSEGMKKVFRLMLPVMVSTWVLPINQVINSQFGSGLFSGSGVSAVEYAYNLYTVIAGVFVLSVTNFIFPKLSRENASGDTEAFRRTISGTMRAVLYVVLPMTAGLFVMAYPLVNFIYGGGRFDAFSVSITSRALMWMSLGMVGYAAQAVLCRVYFAEQKGTVPLLAGAASIAVNAGLCWALTARFDVAGIAAASALAFTVNGAVMALPLRRKGYGFVDRAFARDIGKMLVSAAAMAAAVYFLRLRLEAHFGKLAVLVVPAVFGVVVYYVLTVLLRVPESAMLRRGGKGGAGDGAPAPGGLVRGSFVLRGLTAAAGWIDRQWAASAAARAYVRPPKGERAGRNSVFAKAARKLHGAQCTAFRAVRLDRALDGSLLCRAPFWAILTAALVPLVPTKFAILLAAASFLAVFNAFGCSREREAIWSPVKKWVWLYAAIYLLSTFTSVTVSGSLKGGLLTTAFILFALVLQSAVRRERETDWLVYVIVAVGAFVSLYGIYQYVTGASGAAAWLDESMFSSLSVRVYSTFENPNMLSAYLILVTPLAFSACFTAKTQSGKTLAAAAFLLMLAAMVLTFSRGGWLGILFAAAIFLVMLDRRFLFLGLALLAAMFVVMPQSVVSRFTSIGNMADSSTSYRVAIWKGTLLMLKDYWFCGIGPGTAAFRTVYPTYSYASALAQHSHNLYLQTVCDCGVCGLFTFLAVCFSSLKSTASAIARGADKKRRVRLMAVNSGLFGFLVEGMTDFSFYNYRVMLMFWAFVGLGMILTREPGPARLESERS